MALTVGVSDQRACELTDLGVVTVALEKNICYYLQNISKLFANILPGPGCA